MTVHCLLTPAQRQRLDRFADTGGAVTLLQVGHHGSKTATGAAFLAKTRPKYAVISVAKPSEGTNDGYCHSRAVTVGA